MPNIRREQIHPSLRAAGEAIRFVLPYYTPERLRWASRVMDKFLKGRWLGRQAECESVSIPRADGSALRLLVCVPKKPKKDAPGVLWLHGGGYAIELPEADFPFIEKFCALGGCAVVAPDYRTSLEAPYPAALDDSYLALKWLKAHAEAYGVRSDQLFVGGDSAGGGLTAAVCMLARDRGEISVAFQMPLYPMLDDRMTTPSARENDAPVWNTKSNECAWKLYLGELYGTPDVPVYAAPARAEDFSRLPPAVTFVGGVDMFLDETRQYVERLREAGVEARMRVFPGCFHGFDILAPFSEVGKEAARFLTDEFQYAQAHYFAPQPEDLGGALPPKPPKGDITDRI